MAIDMLTAIRRQKDLARGIILYMALVDQSPTQPNQFLILTDSLALYSGRSHLPNTVKPLNAHGI
jgi:hypothetical protein